MVIMDSFFKPVTSVKDLERVHLCFNQFRFDSWRVCYKHKEMYVCFKLN